MIDISKWTYESMWNEVLNKQCLGVKYHHEMLEIFSLIDMKGYVKWQEYRLKDETEEEIRLQLKYIKKFKKIFKKEEQKETLLKAAFLTENSYSIDNKRNIIESLFTSWLEWEKSVCDLYMGCIQWCVLNQCQDYILFSECLKNVHKEKEKLVYHFSKLQDCKYNMSDILEWQEYLYDKYKNKLDK